MIIFHYRSVLLMCLFCSAMAYGDYRVTDYLGRQVVLENPAQRIVALAPHIVENLFAAGAGTLIVGAVEYCDYPQEANAIPRVGAISTFSLEAIIALKPDLVVVWHSGHGGDVLKQLERIGIPVYASDPHALNDISRSIRDYGVLTNNRSTAEKNADAFDQSLAILRSQNSELSIVTVFYQVWADPLQTLNGKHIISDVIQLCGGKNIFFDAIPLAPKISIESVIQRNPDVIMTSGKKEERPERYGLLKAAQYKKLNFIPPDIIQRHTPRILQGAQLVCKKLAAARSEIIEK